MGTYLKFFTMLEDSCRILDFKLIVLFAIPTRKIDETRFDGLVETQRKVIELESSAKQFQEKIDLVFDVISAAIIQDPENEVNIKQIYQPILDHLHSKMQEKVNRILKCL